MSEEVITMNTAGVDLSELADDPQQDNIEDYDPAEEMPEEEPEYDDPERRKIIINWLDRAKRMPIASKHVSDVDIGSLPSMPFGDLEQLFESKKAMIKANTGNIMSTGFQMVPIALEMAATGLEEEGKKHLAKGYADALTKDYGYNQSVEVVELDLVERGVTGFNLPAPVMALSHAAKVYVANRMKNQTTALVASAQMPTDLGGAIGRL